MGSCDCEIEATDRAQNKALIVLMLINAAMFLVEIGVGIVSESTALIADSLDMLADATVYGIALYAVGRSAMAKIKAARLSGMFQILLGLSVLVEVTRRLIWGSEPESWLMMAVGVLALAANTACLMLIAKHRRGEVHMRASWIFSKNDVIANLGIIAAGILVHVLDSRFPDLVIGAAIAILVVRGGVSIVKDAAGELRGQGGTP